MAAWPPRRGALYARTSLGFDAANGTGAIRGADGARYNFTAADWKGGGTPAANDEVDFEAVETRATEIFVTRAALNLNLSLDKIGQSVDTDKLRGIAVPLLGSWHPILALIALVACFWTFMSAVAPAGVNLPGLSPNLFGAPGAIKRGLASIGAAGDMMSQLNQYGQPNAPQTHNYAFVVSLAGILPLALYLIPLGSVLIVIQESRRPSAMPRPITPPLPMS